MADMFERLEAFVEAKRQRQAVLRYLGERDWPFDKLLSAMLDRADYLSERARTLC